jgi:hypothetical protein
MTTSYFRRAGALFSVVALILAFASPAFATAESEEPEGEAPAVAPAPAAEDVPEPAVPIEEAPPADATPEWTFRFLLPTTLALGGLAVVGTTIAYFVRVTKARYRVVE